MIYIHGKNIDDKIIYDNNLDIVVFSPSFCWFDIIELPTKRISKAKKIAAHIMSNRPEEYKDIEVVKYEDKYKVFCFDKSNIEEILNRIGKINSLVFFAHELNINTSISLDDNLSLISYSNKIIEYKGECETTTTFSKYITTNDVLPSKPILKLNPNKEESKNLMIYINVILFCIVSIYTYTQYSTFKSIQKAQDSIQKDDKSGYEIKSLIRGYEAKKTKSLKMKKSLENILKNNKDLENIEYRKGKFNV